ncbi:DUF7118 family protein [Halobaculum gomorrense]|uniref:Uncharacterized protein n=1 Tax=Halobaculum gomorrense TaxID=43928 RepID=A0A1M5Q5T2_9EURY|nr:hypothetical protein [Halobaculum gomorrense]SHH09286.1 hypothetical protein SAMN05443636_1752 [Halobaculum gomorrense]
MARDTASDHDRTGAAGESGASGASGTAADAPDPLPDADRDADAIAADLREARRRRDDATAAVEEHGESTLATVRDAVERADRLLDRYVDSATGTGDFQAYVEFQGEFAAAVDDLGEDVPGYDAFERANEAVDGRRLSESDFERAREALAPARDLADRLAEREDAEAALHDAERDAQRRLDALEERITDLERLVELGEADLTAPTEELRDPIAAYNDAVRDAFAEFRREEPACDVLAFVAEAAETPFVGYAAPPPELLAFLNASPADGAPLPDLLEYADYSASKLDHYVDDPGTFTAQVRPHRTYLERLSAAPLTVDWPPPAAETLRFKREELVSAVAKFAPEDVVARARELREAADHPEYERLRRAAEAAAELSDAEAERVASGEAAAELAEARRRRKTLADALDGPER